MIYLLSHCYEEHIAMAIPTPYLSFATILRDLGSLRPSPQWSKSAECDRIVNLIYDQLLTSSTSSQVQRTQALAEYHAVKRSMAQGWYPHAELSARVQIRDFTFNNDDSDPYS